VAFRVFRGRFDDSGKAAEAATPALWRPGRRGEGAAGEWGRENRIPLSPFLCPDLFGRGGELAKVDSPSLISEKANLEKRAKEWLGKGMVLNSFAPILLPMLHLLVVGIEC
jgi:hypothetical protein